MFSILILTQDEESDLEACLDSISWCDDIWVLDSGSVDKTVDIAERRGCHVLRRKFDNFADQRNYAIDNADFKHRWVFDLDADERFTDELRQECEDAVRKDELSAYFVANKMMLHGKWIRHASQFPVYQMRFHKLGEIRFVPYGHGQREGDAERGIGYMKAAYIHYAFSKGLAAWFRKHVEYAKREAVQLICEENGCATVCGQSAASVASPVARRRRLKRLAAKMPARPFLKFIYLMFIKGGILDGPTGWLYCRMQAHYEFLCTALLSDLRKTR